MIQFLLQINKKSINNKKISIKIKDKLKTKNDGSETTDAVWEGTLELGSVFLL